VIAYCGQTRSADLIAELNALGIGECTQRGEIPPRRAARWFHDNKAFADWRAGRSFRRRRSERGMTRQTDLFLGAQRLQMDQSIALTIDSLNAYGPSHDHWAIAWSGGKDTTTLVTLVMYLIGAGKVAPPKMLTVLYADTRLELLPLWIAARSIRDELEERGIDVRVVMAPLDKRFLVYVHGERGSKVLMLTGVRQGERAIRDGRIAMSCGRDGGECGQGWYQETLPDQLCDTLAPLLHWRVCQLWAWLRHWAPLPEFGDFSTEIIADAYGGDEAEEVNARTGWAARPELGVEASC